MLAATPADIFKIWKALELSLNDPTDDRSFTGLGGSPFMIKDEKVPSFFFSVILGPTSVHAYKLFQSTAVQWEMRGRRWNECICKDSKDSCFI